MNKTKYKIIHAAITLFNELGLMNVRNQDIAKEAGMSLSNFNYHFKTKQDLVFAVIEYMKSVLQEKVYGNKVLIQEGQGLEITKSYFEFEEQFRFFYLDTYNILQSYPELKIEMRQQIQEAILVIKNLNYLAVGKGYLKPAPPEMPDLYDKLADQIWINNHFWFTQMEIRGLKEDIVLKGLDACVFISYPYLTEKGKQVYMGFIEKVKAEKNIV
ncbi:MAG: TetR/AcrR family transcriptional regulator [Bacteroidota bacterium]